MLGAFAPVAGHTVGAAVGFVVGIVVGIFQSKQRREERQRLEYARELYDSTFPKLQAAKKQLLRNADDQVTAYARALTKHLEDELIAQGESLAA